MRGRTWLIGAAGLVGVILLGAAVVSQTVRFNDIRDRIERDAERALGRTVAIDGEMRLDLLRRTPSLTVEGVRLGNSEGGSAPDMLTADRLEIAVELWPLLSGIVRMRRVDLSGVRLRLETDAEGQGNWQFAGGAAVPGGGSGTLPDIEALHLSDAEILLRSGTDGGEWRLVVDSLTLEMESGRATVALAGEGRIAERVVTVAGSIGSLRALTGGTAPFPVNVSVSLDGLSGRVAGQIADLAALRGVDLRIGLEAASLAGVAALTGLTLPEGQPVRLDARLQDAEAGWLVAIAEARIGDSDAAGRVTILPGGVRPRIEAELASDRIVLDALLLRDGGAAEPVAARSGRVIPDRPLPGLAPLTRIDGRLDWAVERLDTAQTTLRSVAVTASLEEGLLLLDPFEATVPDGGAAALRLEVDAGARPARLSARLRTERFDLGRMLADLGAGDMLVGAVSGEAVLSGQGETTRALVASLDGEIGLAMMNGELRNRFADLLAADLVRVLVPMLVQGERTPVNCLIGRFDVRGGVAESRLLLLDTAHMTVLGDGTVDLVREQLDFRLAPRAKDASLISLAVPLRIHGSFAAPSVGPDELGMARRLGSLALGLVNPLMLIPALSDFGTGDSNPCLNALGETAAELGAPALEDAMRGVGEGIGDAVRGVGEGIGEGLRGIFGR